MGKQLLTLYVVRYTFLKHLYSSNVASVHHKQENYLLYKSL